MSGNNQREFTKGRSSLINLTVLCDELTEHMDEKRTVDVTSLGFCKAFYTFSHNILLSKLGRYRLDGWKLDE